MFFLGNKPDVHGWSPGFDKRGFTLVVTHPCLCSFRHVTGVCVRLSWGWGLGALDLDCCAALRDTRWPFQVRFWFLSCDMAPLYGRETGSFRSRCDCSTGSDLNPLSIFQICPSV